jgi:hypothetical protein
VLVLALVLVLDTLAAPQNAYFLAKNDSNLIGRGYEHEHEHASIIISPPITLRSGNLC